MHGPEGRPFRKRSDLVSGQPDLPSRVWADSLSREALCFVAVRGELPRTATKKESAGVTWRRQLRDRAFGRSPDASVTLGALTSGRCARCFSGPRTVCDAIRTGRRSLTWPGTA